MGNDLISAAGLIHIIEESRQSALKKVNEELIKMYWKVGEFLSKETERASYGDAYIDEISREIQEAFPGIKGFNRRGLYRMKKFYEEYKDLSILPTALAKLPWSHNMLLLDKVKDLEIRKWYAEKCFENGWSHTVLEHQIDSGVYERQVLAEKLTNFNEKLPLPQSELARNIMKDPYIFELEGIKDDYIEKDIENAMLEKIKNILLELGKGFSFVGSQYKISTENQDYYIDLLFYHLELRCYIVVELKNTEFKPEFAGQLSFYVTAVDETIRKEYDNQTIGLLLCKGKDRLSVEWSLKSTNAPIGVSSYEISKMLPKEVLEKLPTEEELNMYINTEDGKQIEIDDSNK